MRNLLIVVYPDDILVARRVDALIAYGRNSQCIRHIGHRLVQLLRKRVGSVDQEPDSVATTEAVHALNIHSAIHTLSVMQGNILLARLRAVKIGCTGFLQHLHGLAAFRCSS